MIVSIESYVRRGRGRIRHLAADPRAQQAGRVGGWFCAGLILSAASLAGSPLPLVLGLLFTLTGWQAAVTALGGSLGYLLFWQGTAAQSLLWIGLGLPAALILGRKKIIEESPLLMPSLAGLILCSCGLGFQMFLGDETGVGIYLLRGVLAAGSTWLFTLVRNRQDPAADWVAAGLFVLGLAQIPPVPGINLGLIAGGMLASGGPLPAAALAGLSLDLARVTSTPMTAVLSLTGLVRLLPLRNLRFFAPGCIYLLVMSLCGVMDPLPAAALALGGGLAVLLPPSPEISQRRGETALAQVRLEMMAGVFSETQQLLTEVTEPPIDEEALLSGTRERACSSCPCRKSCQGRLQPLPEALLHRPLLDTTDLSYPCKKPGRMIMELRRAQSQLRTLRADRERQEEYRWALIQQYQFLSRFLQDLSDQLPRRGKTPEARFRPEVYLSSSGRESANGDRCLWFSGPHGRYFVLLCDGMGTGLGAAREGQTAAAMLRQMLRAGFPAEYALRSLNSLLALRGQAGSVTCDLAEIRLDTGRVSLYKWGAAPSWLIREKIPEKIGTVGPPPGLSVTDGRETVDRLSLSRGEVLILISDGVDGEAVGRRISQAPEDPPGEMAEKLLELGSGEDDATAVVIRLIPGAMIA